MMSQTPPSAPKVNYPFLVFFLVTVSALGSFVNDMYTPALPAMCRFFGCQVSVAQLGLTMGMVGLGLGQILLGPISDRYGRKPVLIGSVILFIVAAVASIFSPNIHVFNISRLFQGLGASGGYFLARTIPADLYSGRALARLMAITGAINGVAPASAPVIGGVTADASGMERCFPRARRVRPRHTRHLPAGQGVIAPVAAHHGPVVEITARLRRAVARQAVHHPHLL